MTAGSRGHWRDWQDQDGNEPDGGYEKEVDLSGQPITGGDHQWEPHKPEQYGDRYLQCRHCPEIRRQSSRTYNQPSAGNGAGRVAPSDETSGLHFLCVCGHLECQHRPNGECVHCGKACMPAEPSGTRFTSNRVSHAFRQLTNAHASFDLDALEVLHVALRELSSPENAPTGYAEGWNAAVKTMARTPLEDVSDAELETAVNSDDPIESLDRLTRPQMMNRPCKCGHDEWHHCVNEGRIKPDLSCRACECVQFNPK